jgi:class 3 adenylate cyclase
MGAGLSTEVLLALLEAPADGIGGVALQEQLAVHRRQPPRSDELMVRLLRLEATGHVTVRRADAMRFGLTERGRARAYEVAGGRTVHLRLLMADLVGFVAYTAAHGDEAAHDAASALAHAASAVVRSEGGEVVKGLGDGFLAWLPPTVEPLPVMAELRRRCTRPTGDRWSLRGASHLGTPIRHGGDLFGSDVNLVARLCAAAGPDELVLSHPGAGRHDIEQVLLRGLAEPVPVVRVALA